LNQTNFAIKKNSEMLCLFFISEELKSEILKIMQRKENINECDFFLGKADLSKGHNKVKKKRFKNLYKINKR